MGVLEADSNELVLVDVEVNEDTVEPRFRGTAVKLPVELPEAGVNMGEGDEVNSGPTVGSVMFDLQSKGIGSAVEGSGRSKERDKNKLCCPVRQIRQLQILCPCAREVYNLRGNNFLKIYKTSRKYRVSRLASSRNDFNR